MMAAMAATLMNFAARYYQSIIVVTIAVIIIMMKASRNCFADCPCRHRYHLHRYFAATVWCFIQDCPSSTIGFDIVVAG